MVIKITNPVNNLTLSFLGYREYVATFGYTSPKEDESIALTNGCYRLYSNISGVYSLPNNNTNMQVGIDQDGSTLQNNYYSNRQIIFNFKQILSSNFIRQNQILAQNNYLLNIEIINNEQSFYIQGTLVGNSENGIIELSCPFPFYRTNTKYKQSKLILKNNLGVPFFPINLSQKQLFPDSKGNNTIEVYADFKQVIKMTLKGKFTNALIKNATTGSELQIIATCNIQTVIEDNSVIIDGADYTESTTGMFPDMTGGKNKYEITFDTMITDVEVIIEYDEIVSTIW